MSYAKKYVYPMTLGCFRFMRIPPYRVFYKNRAKLISHHS